MNISIKRLFAISVLLVCLLIPQEALALENANYVTSPNYWYDNENTKEIDLSTISNNPNLSGQFKYFTNTDSFEVYIYANITEKTITDKNTGFYFSVTNKYKNNQKINIFKSTSDENTDYEFLTKYKITNGFAKNTIGFKLINKNDINCKTTITAGIVIGEQSYPVMTFTLGNEKIAKSSSKSGISSGSSSTKTNTKSKSKKVSSTKFSATYSRAISNDSKSGYGNKDNNGNTGKYSYSQSEAAKSNASNNSVISKGNTDTNVNSNPIMAEVGRESKKLSTMSKIGIIVGAAIIVIGIILFVIKNKKVRDIICRSVKDTNENA